jgi:hypothetical protein
MNLIQVKEMVHTCLRCGYEDKQFFNVKRHINRKKLCDPIFSDTDREECILFLKSDNKNYGVYILMKEIKKLRQINVLQEKDLEINKFKETIVSMQDEIDKLKMTQLPVISEQKECIYLLIEREFIDKPLKVVKLGRSKCFKNRMRNYPKNSTLLCVNKCNDSVKAEQDLLVLFNMMFKQCSGIGNEYFEGETSQMIKQVNGYFYNNT